MIHIAAEIWKRGRDLVNHRAWERYLTIKEY